MMTHEEVDWLLTQWGIWSRRDGTGKLSDTSSAMFAGLTPHGKNDDYVEITDEQAMHVDFILTALNGFDHMNWVVVVMSYYYCMSDSAITKHFKKCGQPASRRTTQIRRERGCAFVSGFIYAV